MNILVISSNYPSPEYPNHGAFVYNLMQELAKKHEITVISPRKVHYLFKKKQGGYGREDCTVLRPAYISISNKTVAGFNLGQITTNSYIKAVQKEINNLKVKPDVVYTHFLSNAIPVLDYVEKNQIPLVVASGESTYDAWLNKSDDIQNKVKQLVDHIICVSNENKEQLTTLGFDLEKLSVIPNAVNYEVFRPLDKEECKKKLGVESNKFTVGFIGHFIHRKGPNRVIEAIKKLNDDNIQFLCVGGKSEELIPNHFTKVLGPVANYQLPEIYNAFDIFVLPTLHEGHCNVIEEAKAVCIPIVSSRGTSVEEQVDESVAILVDPLNIKEIAEAILKLKKDKQLYDNMVNNLIDKRGLNSLAERGKKIGRIITDTKEASFR